MTISVQLASEALVVAAFVLAAFAIPKLLIYFILALFKMMFLKNISKVTRWRYVKSLIKGDIWEDFLKESDKPASSIKWVTETYFDYLCDIKEPSVEAVTAIVLIQFISGYIGFDSPLPLIFTILTIILFALIIASLSLALFISRELSKLKREIE